VNIIIYNIAIDHSADLTIKNVGKK